MQTTGTPDYSAFPLPDWERLDLQTSVVDGAGNLITTGNTAQSGGHTDVLVTKHDEDGAITWQKTYNGSASGNDYGGAVILDAQGNAYVAGVVTDAGGLPDLLLLKYNASGTLQWSQIWQKSALTYDVPIRIALDPSGNIIVAGISVDAAHQSDYFVLKYSNSGTLSWDYDYDENGYNDIPLNLDFDTSGNVIVLGLRSPTDTTVQFGSNSVSLSTGTQVDANAQLLSNMSLQDIYDFTIDIEDNIYVVGVDDDNGKDMKVIKLTPSFQVEWTQSFDGNGMEDIGRIIEADNLGNLVLAGTSVKPTEGTDILTIKISPGGQEIWRRAYMAPLETGIAKPIRMRITQDDNIFITGAVDDNNSVNITTYMYDADGNIRLEKIFDAGSDSRDEPIDIRVVNDRKIYVNGRSRKDGETDYRRIHYDCLFKDPAIVYENGEPHHLDQEVIVKFYPQYVDTNFVNDKDKRYGTLSEVLPNSVITELSQRVNIDATTTVIKIFHRLSTDHTSSITRLDETIDMPEFWATFLLCLPDTVDLQDEIDALNSYNTEYVEYAEYNYLYQKDNVPDDAFINANAQLSLFASPTAPFQNAHINVDPAWDLETGQDYTKVGVYDGTLFWAHPDFGGPTFGGSQVVGGWDFENDISIQNVTSPVNSHGTACAGIIGALRDNNATGIAGIAGGGPDGGGTENPGVQLFSIGIGEEDLIETADIAPAIIEGAMSDPTQQPPGYGLHIMNASWGGQGASFTLRNAVRFAFRNQVLLVASKGNGGTNDAHFPADFNDFFALNVGASGTDGEYKGLMTGNGDTWRVTGTTCAPSASNFGNGIDVIAPGVTELITTLINPASPTTFSGTCTGDVDIYPAPVGTGGAYQPFNGTSAAAPHVAGVAALMHGLHHVNKDQWNSLAPEDYEFMIQKYADDIAGPNYPVGYDDRNGWGRVNAGAVIERLEAPEWRVFHSEEPNNTIQTTAPSLVVVGIPGGISTLPAGNYVAGKSTYYPYIS